MPNHKYYLPVIIILATVLLFLKIGSRDLMEWDESRNGSNAYEMIQKGDYINYYYAGEVDTWNSKPPLYIWFVILCYKLFGYNEFALRLPVVIMSIFFFLYFYKLISLLTNTFTAFVCCLILLTCKAIIGPHVGISGDFDAPLLLFLTASVYYFIQYAEFGKINAIYSTAIFTALAFYTKGPAAFVCIPGLLLYALLRKKASCLLKNPRTWTAILLFFVLAGSWVVLIYKYGKSPEHTTYGSENALEVMFVHDTYNRLTSADFGERLPPDYGFFFSAIDARMNIWNYLFYLSLAIGVSMLVKHRRKLREYLQEDNNRMPLLAICMILPLAGLLTFATHKHAWYLAPVFGFIAYIVAAGMISLSGKLNYLRYAWIAIFAFTFIRHIHYLYTTPETLHNIFTRNHSYFANRDQVLITEVPKQNVFLYLQWLNINLIKINSPHDLDSYYNELMILKSDKLVLYGPRLKVLKYFDGYCIAQVAH